MIIENNNATLPESEMKLLVADAVRYRFLRDVVPLMHKDLEAIGNYDWDTHLGFESIFFANGEGYSEAISGKELDKAIDAELFNAVSKEKP